MNGQTVPPEDESQYWLDLGIESLTPNGSRKYSIDDAERCFRNAVAFGSHDGMYNLALLLLHFRGSPEDREEALSLLVRLESVSYGDARKELTSLVLDNDPDIESLSIDELLILADMYVRSGLIDRVIDICKIIDSKLDLNNCHLARYLFKLSEVCIDSGYSDLALKYASESVDAGCNRANILIGRIYLNYSDDASLDVAISFFQQAVEFPESFYWLGRAYEGKKQYVLAANCYKFAFKFDIPGAKEALYSDPFQAAVLKAVLENLLNNHNGERLSDVSISQIVSASGLVGKYASIFNEIVPKAILNSESLDNIYSRMLEAPSPKVIEKPSTKDMLNYNSYDNSPSGYNNNSKSFYEGDGFER